MAVERKRGCGYRKVGGLYLVSGGAGQPCDRLPFPLDVCPVCSHGFKQARGWQWVDVAGLFEGDHIINPDDYRIRSDCPETGCPACRPKEIGRAGLLWIGEQFYPMPADFIAEGVAMGFSRRIKAIPRGFKVGETWVLLAHHKAVLDFTPDPENPPLEGQTGQPKYKPGIFQVWKPSRVEKIITETQSKDEAEMKKLADAGITPVIVPDNDKDHQGTVYDKEEETNGTLRTDGVTA